MKEKTNLNTWLFDVFMELTVPKVKRNAEVRLEDHEDKNILFIRMAKEGFIGVSVFADYGMIKPYDRSWERGSISSRERVEVYWRYTF